jgi:hypothetical protein
MRRLFLILVACAPGFADTLSTSATCNGVTYYGKPRLPAGTRAQPPLLTGRDYL